MITYILTHFADFVNSVAVWSANIECVGIHFQPECPAELKHS